MLLWFGIVFRISVWDLKNSMCIFWFGRVVLLGWLGNGVDAGEGYEVWD